MKLQCRLEVLEDRHMLAADLVNFELLNDTGIDANDKITTDPTVTATTTGDYMDYSTGTTKVEYDHHGDGSVDGEIHVYSPGETVTYDARINEPTLDTYQGAFNLRYRVVTYDYMTGSEVYSTAWTDFNMI